MIENENKTLIILDDDENVVTNPVSKQEKVLEEQQIINGVITVPIALDVKIPKGFHWCEGQTIDYSVSVDIHTIRALVTLVEAATSTSLPLYFVRLEGTISYNVLVTGFEPIAGTTVLTEGSSNGTYVLANLPCKAAFNRAAQRNIEETLGFVNSIEEVELDLSNNFYIDVIKEPSTVILADGTYVTFDPTNPTAYYSQFNGNDDLVFVATFSIIANTTLGPES